MADSTTFFSRAVRRLRRDKGAVVRYTLGRFYAVRRAYAFQRRLRRGARPQDLAQSIFPGVDVAAALDSIRDTSVYYPVMLPAGMVRELRAFAETSPLRSFDLEGREFFLEDVRDGHLSDGSVITWAHVKHIQEHPLANRIAFDPKALEVISRYFGYTPSRADIWMFWSFSSGLTNEDRRKAGQTIDYHFDVHSLNFAYAAYYLTDTNRDNGAHQMVRGSHRRKPFSWLFGSAKQPDERVEAQYGRENVLTIEGPAGTGFWQDSSCYHKALPPEKGVRLLLQARYY
jgi:hypothetical protein